MMKEPLTREYLDAVQKRCDEATSGPWESSIEGRDHTNGENFICRNHSEAEDLYLINATIADHDFIAHARQDIPLLLNEIRRLRELSNMDVE